jgi:hypothetical protein
MSALLLTESVSLCIFLHLLIRPPLNTILRYLKGTSSYGFHITQGSSFALHGFTDANWAGSIDDRKSINEKSVVRFATGEMIYNPFRMESSY